jgi:GNAT superfamily N-acetyltransferase
MTEPSAAPPAPRVANRDWVAVPDPALADGTRHSWESQVGQYPVDGPPGVSYLAGPVPGALPVDCFLWRDPDGALRGIANYYPQDYELQPRGSVNLWVQPGHTGRGIATALMLALRDLRPEVDRQQQQYTEAGARFVMSFLQRHPRD